MTRRQLPVALAGENVAGTLLLEGEPVWDDVAAKLRLGDGVRLGGQVLATQDDAATIFEFGLPGIVADWGPVFTAALQSGKKVRCPPIILNGAVQGYVQATPVNCVPADGAELIMEGGAFIQPTFANADYFYLGAANVDTWNVKLRGLRFKPSVHQQAGYYAIHFKRANNCYCYDVVPWSIQDWVPGTTGPVAGGFYFEQFGSCGIFGGGVCGTSGDGLTLCGDANDENYGAAFDVDDNTYFYGCNWAIHMAGSVGGLNLNDVNISACANGLRVSCLNTNDFNRELFTSQFCNIDSTPGHGVLVEPGALAIWLGDGLWLVGCGAANIPACWIQDIVQGGPQAQTEVSLSLIRANSNYYDGWRQECGAFNARVEAYTNGQGSAAGGHAFDFSAGNLSGLFIEGAVVGSGNATRGYGVAIAAGVTEVSCGAGGVGNGQELSVYDYGAPSASRIIRQAPGYICDVVVQVMIPAGSTTVTVNHGLSQTPTGAIPGLNGPIPAGLGQVSVTGLTATQLTVMTNSAPTSEPAIVAVNVFRK